MGGTGGSERGIAGLPCFRPPVWKGMGTQDWDSVIISESACGPLTAPVYVCVQCVCVCVCVCAGVCMCL